MEAHNRYSILKMKTRSGISFLATTKAGLVFTPSSLEPKVPFANTILNNELIS